MNQKPSITVESVVNAPVEKVWEFWTKPEHIVQWAFASDDWEAPHAENDVRVGGKFKTVMAAKRPSFAEASEGRSKSTSFDFTGMYTALKTHEVIEYDMDDGPPSPDGFGRASRHVKVTFEEVPGGVKVIETFDPENENPLEMQRSGWQAMLDNFKKYVEGSN